MPKDPHPAEVLAVLRRADPRARIAVVGASNNTAKYGSIITRNLAGKGYTVLPINPAETEVHGLAAYPTLADAPGPIDIVDFVTPPAVTKKVLEEVGRLGLPAVWLQDGSFDDEVLAMLEGASFRAVHHACIMVASN